MKKTPKALYIACTPDKYELPFAVGDTAKELGDLLGVSAQQVHQAISRRKHNDLPQIRRSSRGPAGRWKLYKVVMALNICPVCGTEFEPRNGYHVYCTHACREAAQKRREEEKRGLQGRNHHRP